MHTYRLDSNGQLINLMNNVNSGANMRTYKFATTRTRCTILVHYVSFRARWENNVLI